ncbi:MAG: hypothetical protein ACFFE4_05755 [Candidatus Thorarchaeota archaeon]
MNFGVISCVIGILTIIFEQIFLFFAVLYPINVIVSIIVLLGGILGLTIFFLILSIITVILGGLGLTKDPSTGFAKGGILLGIVGIILGVYIIMTELGILFSP